MAAFRSGFIGRAGDWLLWSLYYLFAPATVKGERVPHSVRRVLAEAERIEIYSLDPLSHQNGDAPDRFHGYRILGRVQVEDRDERARIGTALSEGNCRTRGSTLCFDPSFGVSALQDQRRVEMLICFWCGNAEIIGPGSHRRVYPFAHWPSRPLTRQLRAARVPVAEEP